MTAEIGLIFDTIGLARSVAEFAGLIDSIEAKLDRLVQSELNAGLRALEQAAQATSEQPSLLRDARGSFNRAVSLELGFRRVVALLGLSVCHHWLDDRRNCLNTLKEILEINPVSKLGYAKAVGRQEFVGDIREAWAQWGKLASARTISDVTKTILLSKGLEAVLERHPVTRWGRLVFSKSARGAYRRKVIVSVVETNPEAKAIYCIQAAVSRHIRTPIAWLDDLDQTQAASNYPRP